MIWAVLAALSMFVPCAQSPDGSWACKLDLSDGTEWSYKTFRVDGVYPSGLSCDELGRLWVFDGDLNREPLPCRVDRSTGSVSCAPTGVFAPTGLTAVVQ